MKPLRSIAHVLTVAFLACQGPAQPGHSVSVDTTQTGVIVTLSTGPGQWSANPSAAWRLQPIGVIGSIDGADAAPAFTSPFEFDHGPDRNLYVLDVPGTSIHVISREGVLLREIGRGGEGPGEFERASAFEFDGDSLLWVLDGAAGRLSSFDLEGRFKGGKALPYRLGRFRHGHARLAAGKVWDIVQIRRRTSVPGGGVRVSFDGVGSIGVSASLAGDQGDTVTVASWRPDMGMVRQTGSTTMTSPPPYAPRAIYSVARDGGLWAANGSEYRIAHVVPGGDTTRIIGRTLEPTRLSDEHAEELAEWEREMRRSGAEPVGSGLPTHYPFIEQIVESDQGSVWVWRRGPNGHDIDVFEPDGVFLGTIQSPPTSIGFSAPPTVSNGVLATASRGALDVPLIALDSVVRPERRVP